MISTKRHVETDPKSGKNLYIINVPNKEFEGRRYGVRFYKGKGRTTSRGKAVWFSEQFEYEVVLHKSEEPWEEAYQESPNTAVIMDEDSDYTSDAEGYELDEE